jgi:uncharacterized membrane protein
MNNTVIWSFLDLPWTAIAVVAVLVAGVFAALAMARQVVRSESDPEDVKLADLKDQYAMGKMSLEEYRRRQGFIKIKAH